jgi:hypothetical protein
VSLAQLKLDRVKWLKAALFGLCLVPFARLVWLGTHSGLGANPIEYITRSTGWWTLSFLLITLSVTPLRRLTGWNWLLRLRRMLGLFAFFSVSLHFTTYIWLDQFFDLHSVYKDIYKRPFITVGFTASTMSAKLAKLREAILCRPARADDVSDSGGLAAKVATAHTAPASARPHTAPLPSAPATLVEKIRFAIDPSAREDSGRSLLGVAATSAAASRGTPARFVRLPQRSLNQRAVAKAVPCVAAHEIVGAALHSRWVGGSEYLAATFRMEICGTDRLPGKLRRLR